MIKKADISGTEISYAVAYRNIRNARLEFKGDILQMIIPAGKTGIEKELLVKHRKWILRTYRQITESLNEISPGYLDEKMNIKEFKYFVNAKTDEFSRHLKVSVNNVKFRAMISQLGSMSVNGSMTINSYARFFPERLVEYIIYHELAHLKVRKHGKRFWGIIAGRYGDYRRYELDLFKYWIALQVKLGL
ncbi:MAG: M48 family metallopeptidase [Elusimicrobiota bacterium]